MGKGIVNELAQKKTQKRAPVGGMAEEDARSETEDHVPGAMQEEDSRGQKKQVVARVIKKKRLTKAQQKNEALYAHRESEKVKADRKRAEIKARLRNKKEVKLEPTLLKSYQEKFETESKKLLGEKKLAPGKRKRLKKRASRPDRQNQTGYATIS